MKKLTQFVFVVFVLMLPAELYAQGTLLEMERELVKISSVLDDSSYLDIRCGDYFLFGQYQIGDSLPPRIAYLQKRELTDPVDIQLGGLFLPEKFVVRIDSTKKVPTLELVMVGKEVQGIIVKINQLDYEKCTCLPKPMKTKVTPPKKQ